MDFVFDLINREVIFADEYCPEDYWKKLSKIRVKVVDWESGEDYGYVKYDGHITPEDCYSHFTYKVGCFPLLGC